MLSLLKVVRQTKRRLGGLFSAKTVNRVNLKNDDHIEELAGA